MIGYGLGDAGTGLAATQLGFYLFAFFTCTAALPPRSRAGEAPSGFWCDR